MSIEESCIKFAGDTSYVEILKGMDKKEQIFERKDVKTGMSDGVYIEILEGLTTEDKVKGNLQMK